MAGGGMVVGGEGLAFLFLLSPPFPTFDPYRTSSSGMLLLENSFLLFRRLPDSLDILTASVIWRLNGEI